jgi:hypothetical protein
MNSVSFGFELVNLYGNGADAYFPVTRNMVLETFNIDAAFMLTSAPAAAGFAEVLCQGKVSRGSAPVFAPTVQAYAPFSSSADFGAVSIDNPMGLQAIFDGGLGQDLFYSVILKSWVPLDGAGSTAARQVSGRPSLALSAGDYLAFHMDHAGVGVDCELQIVLGYSRV